MTNLEPSKIISKTKNHRQIDLATLFFITQTSIQYIGQNQHFYFCGLLFGYFNIIN